MSAGVNEMVHALEEEPARPVITMDWRAELES